MSKSECSLSDNNNHGNDKTQTCVLLDGVPTMMDFSSTASGSFKKVYFDEKNNLINKTYVVSNGSIYKDEDLEREINIQRELTETGVVPAVIGEVTEYTTRENDKCIQFITENAVKNAQTVGVEHIHGVNGIDMSAPHLTVDPDFFTRVSKDTENMMRCLYDIAIDDAESAYADREMKDEKKKKKIDEHVMMKLPQIRMTLLFFNSDTPDIISRWCLENPVMRALFRSMKAVHDKGYVHCDLKDDNMFYDFESDKVTLIDFGMAWKIQEHEKAIDDAFRKDIKKFAKYPALAETMKRIYRLFREKKKKINRFIMAELNTVHKGMIYSLFMVNTLQYGIMSDEINSPTKFLYRYRTIIRANKGKPLDAELEKEIDELLNGVYQGYKLHLEIARGVSMAYEEVNGIAL